jgi:hypothetical protein
MLPFFFCLNVRKKIAKKKVLSSAIECTALIKGHYGIGVPMECPFEI